MIDEKVKKEVFERIDKEGMTGDEVIEMFDLYFHLTGDEYVKRFAQSLTANDPFMLNQVMQDLNMNPLTGTEKEITDALNSPKSSEDFLMSFSQGFEVKSTPYKSLLSYLENLNSFDLVYVCINANIERSRASSTNDYKSLEYKKDEQIVENFLDKFNCKEEFTKAIGEMLRNGAFFCCPRFDSKMSYTLQELPPSTRYTKITGRFEYGYLFDYNMNWFAQTGVNIDEYPVFFKEKYNEMFYKNGNKEQRNRTNINNLGGISYANWQAIPPDVGWCFKLDPYLATRIPYFSGMFLDLMQQPRMRDLQKDNNIAAAAKVVLGEIPLLKDVASKAKDNFALSPTNLGKFLAHMKAALNNINVVAIPLSQTKEINFPHQDKIYSSYLKTALATSGVDTNIIFSHTEKLNSIEAQQSLNKDEIFMQSLYSQFENFLNYFVNRFTKKFKFRFYFEGSNFYTDRERRLDTQMKLVEKGIVLPKKISAALGMKYADFERQLAEARDKEWVDKLTPVIPGSQQSLDDVGRPKSSDSNLSDSAEQTRSDGGNIDKGGSV